MKDKIRDRIFDEVNTIFLNYQEDMGIESGDILPWDEAELDNCMDTIADIITRVLHYQNGEN